MSLLQKIFDQHPDIQPADIVRVLSFLGYSAEEMQDEHPSYIEIKGITYYPPWELGKLVPPKEVVVSEE